MLGFVGRVPDCEWPGWKPRTCSDWQCNRARSDVRVHWRWILSGKSRQIPFYPVQACANEGETTRRWSVTSQTTSHSRTWSPVEVESVKPGDHPNAALHPLLFISGPRLGAWAFRKHFLPFFARQGFEVHAMTFPSDRASVEELCVDVELVAASLRQAPILVGHAEGGFVAQACIQRNILPFPRLILLSSLPPSGLGILLLRKLLTEPYQFGRTLLQRVTTYHSPTPTANDAEDTGLASTSMWKKGMFCFVALSKQRASLYGENVLVMGVSGSPMLDPISLSETAAWWETKPVILSGTSDDIMLDSEWNDAASMIADWLHRAEAVDELIRWTRESMF
uniref:AB hydrolase-1 domain-containing protein n=1 Tax=Compsopogon caeruleus TaxID=31354 RepID=A0A7S1TGV6_9RHOD